MNGNTTSPGPPAPARILFCPGCSHRYALDARTLADPSLVVLCAACGTAFRPAEGDRPAGSAVADARAAPSPAAARPSVVVAHDSPAVCATVGRVLEDAGYAARFVHDGARAVAAFDGALPDRPVALVLDVAIPEVLAFQVCTILKNRPDALGVPIILLASVYERTRYKRRPTSLHGADAYLELHHVPDRLGDVLRGVLTRADLPAMRGHLPVERARADAIKPPLEGAPVVDVDGATALARRLVTDVALYHEDAMLRGLKAGDALAEPEVKRAMEEARSMFRAQLVNAGTSMDAAFDGAMTTLVEGLRRGHT